MWLDNVLKRSWFYNSGLFDLKSLPNSNSLDFQKETWTGGILAEWLSGGLRWAGSCLSWVSIAGIGRGGIRAVAKPELHAIGRRWVALWPFPPLCPSTSSCNTRNQFPKLFKIIPNSCSGQRLKAKNLLGLVCWLGWLIQWDHLTRSFDCEFAHWLLLASALEIASYLCHQSSYWS